MIWVYIKNLMFVLYLGVPTALPASGDGPQSGECIASFGVHSLQFDFDNRVRLNGVSDAVKDNLGNGPLLKKPYMPILISEPIVIQAAGNVPKRIEEYVGHVSSGHSQISIARMISPKGWAEPGQTPAFEELTLVLKGCLLVEFRNGSMEVVAGQTVICSPGEWVRYSTPKENTEYVSICLPAFTPTSVNRDEH